MIGARIQPCFTPTSTGKLVMKVDINLSKPKI